MSGYLVMSTWAMLVLVAAHSINADAVGKTDEAKPESRKMELIKAAENPVKSFYKCYECLAGSTSPCKSGSCTGASCIKVEASQGTCLFVFRVLPML